LSFNSTRGVITCEAKEIRKGKGSASRITNVCELAIKRFKLKMHGQEGNPWPCTAVRFWENLVVGIMETRNLNACMGRTERSVHFLSQEVDFEFPEAPLMLCPYKLKTDLGTEDPYPQVTLSTHGQKCN